MRDHAAIRSRRRGPRIVTPNTPAISILPPRANRTMLATMALIGVALLWGSSLAATKPLLPPLPPTTLALLRVVVALGVLLPILRRRGSRIARGRAPALMGLSGLAVAIVCQNLGLRRASTADATLILGASIPLLTLALAHRLLRERLSRRDLGGMVASIGGVAALAALGGEGGVVGASLGGGALLLAAAALLAIQTVIGRLAFATDDALPLVVGSFAYGALFLLPAAAVEVGIVG